MYAINANTGEKLWDFKTGGPVKSSVAIADGRVYFGSHDFHIYSLKAINGEKLWDFRANDLVYSSPVVADGIVYFG